MPMRATGGGISALPARGLNSSFARDLIRELLGGW
jgi:hypothetical protein